MSSGRQDYEPKLSFGPEEARQLVTQALLEGWVVHRFAPGYGTLASRNGDRLFVLVDPRHLCHLDRELLEVLRERSGEYLRPYVEVELAETAEELLPYLSWEEAGRTERVGQMAFERLGEMGR